MNTKLVYTGVDYARYTATDHRPFENWNAMLQSEYLAEDLAGKRIHNRWLLGYFGRVLEHAFLGKNESGCMVQLSGGYAWQNWYEAGNYSERCTRMDLQVTWPVEEPPGEYIREMYQLAVLHKTSNGRKPEPQITDTPRGAKMLTIGSRQSEVYGRMYDKGRESGEPSYASCVRWEIEVKGEQAKDLNAHMREHKDEPFTTRAIVHQFWEARGMKPFWDTYEGVEGTPPKKRTKTDETKLTWLATQVNSVVCALVERGKREQVVRAIFKEALTDEQIEGILRMLAED